MPTATEAGYKLLSLTAKENGCIALEMLYWTTVTPFNNLANWQNKKHSFEFVIWYIVCN